MAKFIALNLTETKHTVHLQLLYKGVPNHCLHFSYCAY